MSSQTKRSRTGFDEYPVSKFSDSNFLHVKASYPKIRGDSEIPDSLHKNFVENVVFNEDNITTFFMGEVRARSEKLETGDMGYTEEVSKCKDGFLVRIRTSEQLEPPLPVNEFYGFGSNKKYAKIRAVAGFIGVCDNLDIKVYKQSSIETLHRLKAAKKLEWKTQTGAIKDGPDYYEEIIIPPGTMNVRLNESPVSIRIQGGRNNVEALLDATMTLVNRSDPKSVPLVHPQEDSKKGYGASFPTNKRLTPNGREDPNAAADDVESFLKGVTKQNLSPNIQSSKGQSSAYTQKLNQFAQKNNYERTISYCSTGDPKQLLHYCKIGLSGPEGTYTTASCAVSKHKACGQSSLLMLQLLNVQASEVLDEISSLSIDDIHTHFIQYMPEKDAVNYTHISQFIEWYVNRLGNYEAFKNIVDQWVSKNTNTMSTHGSQFAVDGDLKALWTRAVCYGPSTPIETDTDETFLSQLVHKVFEAYREINRTHPLISVEDWEELLDMAVYSWGNDHTQPGFIKYFEAGSSPFVLSSHSVLSRSALRYFQKYRYLMAVEAASCVGSEIEDKSLSETGRLSSIQLQSIDRIVAYVKFDDSVCFYGDDDAMIKIDSDCPLFTKLSSKARVLSRYPTFVTITKAAREGATTYRLSLKVIGDTGHANGFIPYLTLCQKHKLEPRLKLKVSTSMSTISNNRMKEALRELTFHASAKATEKVKKRSYRFVPEIRDTILWSPQDSMMKQSVFPQFAPKLCNSTCSQTNGLEVPLGCNDDQVSAIVKSMQNSFSLIWGPPGTGKTRVSAMIMITWLRHFQKIHNKRVKILAVAGTNMGARNLYEVAMEYIPQNEHKVMFVTHNDAFIHNANPQQFAHEVRSADVVVTTCIHIGSPLYAGINFDFCLIDEAGQSLEPSVLVPIGRGVDRVVLVGDHMQLPPLIRSQYAQHNGLGMSLQERLILLGAQCVMLRTQYRMHPSICHWPNYAFYGGYLVDGPVTRDVTVINGIPKHDVSSRVVVVDCNDGSEAEQNKSKYNDSEIDAIYTFLKHLNWTRDIITRDVGIISPYTAQINRLKQRIGPAFRDIEITSVDGFQGREKQLIILSLVRSNSKGELGFLQDDRRMNVQLTRAKRGLVVFCHKRTLQMSRTKTTTKNADWIQWMENQDLVMTKDKFIHELEYLKSCNHQYSNMRY